MISFRNSPASSSSLNPDEGDRDPLRGDMGGKGEVGKDTVFNGTSLPVALDNAVLGPHLAKVRVGRDRGEDVVEEEAESAEAEAEAEAETETAAEAEAEAEGEAEAFVV